MPVYAKLESRNRQGHEVPRRLNQQPFLREPSCLGGSTTQGAALANLAARNALRLRKLRIGLHFEDLLSVPLAMRADKQDPLIPVHFFSERAQDRVLPETLRVFQIVLSGSAAVHEVLQRRLG